MICTKQSQCFDCGFRKPCGGTSALRPLLQARAGQSCKTNPIWLVGPWHRRAECAKRSQFPDTPGWRGLGGGSPGAIVRNKAKLGRPEVSGERCMGRSLLCERKPIRPAGPGAPPSPLDPPGSPLPRDCAKRSQFAILRPARWTRQPPPYAGHTPMRRRLGYRLIGWERCAEKKPASLLAGGRTRRTRDVRPPWCVA
jgi:hypothetical protein